MEKFIVHFFYLKYFVLNLKKKKKCHASSFNIEKKTYFTFYGKESKYFTFFIYLLKMLKNFLHFYKGKSINFLKVFVCKNVWKITVKIGLAGPSKNARP